MPLGCQPTAAVWLCPWQCCAGGIPHWSRLLREITHLPVQAGQGLLFMCLILSALILGVVNISQWLQEELPGAFALQENLTAARGQPKLTWLCCSGYAHPALAGAPTYCWPYNELSQQCKQAENCWFCCLVLSQFPPSISPHKSSLQGWISIGRQRWREEQVPGESRREEELQGLSCKFALP